MSLIVNRIRFYSFISGVLLKQQQDPLCGHCRAFVNTTLRIREGISGLEAADSGELASCPPALKDMFDRARYVISAIPLPEDAPGQKKAGNCLMPEGVCFIKYSKKLLDNIG